MSASVLQKLLSVEYSWLNLNFQDRCRDKCSVGCEIETTFSKMWIKKNNVYLCCEQQDFNIGDVNLNEPRVWYAHRWGGKQEMQLKITKIKCNGFIIKQTSCVPRNAAWLPHRICLSPGYDSYRIFYKKDRSENGDIGIYLVRVCSDILIR